MQCLFFFLFQISKASVPSWRMTLLSVCSLVNNLNSQAEETGEPLITRRKFPTGLDDFSLEAMLTIYQIRNICHSRAYQHWEVKQNQNMNVIIVISYLYHFKILIIVITGRHKYSRRISHVLRLIFPQVFSALQMFGVEKIIFSLILKGSYALRPILIQMLK